MLRAIKYYQEEIIWNAWNSNILERSSEHDGMTGDINIDHKLLNEKIKRTLKVHKH